MFSFTCVQRVLSYHSSIPCNMALYDIKEEEGFLRRRSKSTVMIQLQRWQFRKRCACYEPSLLFDLFKVFDYIESSKKSNFFSESPIFLQTCATCSELPADINTMTWCKAAISILECWITILQKTRILS